MLTNCRCPFGRNAAEDSLHTWCHIWKLLVRPSIVHKFHFIHGAMYGNNICVVPYFASSNSYMVPYMGVTCASFRISQVPIHTWCHVWNLHVRPSVFHKFHFMHGAIYGNEICVLSYFTSFNSCMVPYGSYMSVLPYFTSPTSFMVP